MQFKKSLYTLVESCDGRDFLVNTRSRSVAAFEKEELSEILRFMDNPNDTSYKYFDELYKNGFIIESGIDEQTLLEYSYNRQFFCTNKLFISVLPTTQCNFSCPYCFENDTPSTMSNEDIRTLALAIEKEIPRLNELHVSFFGGEPLLLWNNYKDQFIEEELPMKVIKTGSTIMWDPSGRNNVCPDKKKK